MWVWPLDRSAYGGGGGELLGSGVLHTSTFIKRVHQRHQQDRTETASDHPAQSSLQRMNPGHFHGSTHRTHVMRPPPHMQQRPDVE